MYVCMYIFVGVIEISVYLQFIKSKKYHRQLQKALHATPTLYCACRLVVPSGNENT